MSFYKDAFREAAGTSADIAEVLNDFRSVNVDYNHGQQYVPGIDVLVDLHNELVSPFEDGEEECFFSSAIDGKFRALRF